VLDAVGPAAAERWGVEAGDRVAVVAVPSCRECAQCRSGQYQRCVRHGLRDMYGFVPTERPPGLWGGYAEYQYLEPDTVLHKVPASIDPVLATMFNPLGAGIDWAVTTPGTSPGDVVAVLGPGIRGLCALAAVKEAGAGFVMVTGVGPRDLPRLEVARQFGADLVVDVAAIDPRKALHQAAGRMADVVVDVTAKAPAAFGQAMSLARQAGTVVVAGTRGSDAIPNFSPDVIVLKELHVQGVMGVSLEAQRAALDLLASGRFPFADLPRRAASLETTEDLLRSMAGESDETPPVHGVITP
jgi:alcohol dehydrogenase